MPTYQYKCSTCGSKFEHFHKSLNSTDAVICPKCSNDRVEKTVTAANIGNIGGRSEAYQPAESCQGCCQQGSCDMAYS